MRDLVIAGGGPIGLATALYAARRGLDVVVHEPRRGSIDKACGEGLMPGAVQALSELGLDPDGHEITGIRYVDGIVCVPAQFRHGPGRGVRRTVLHAALHDAAVRAGVSFAHASVTRVVVQDDHVDVDGERSRYLVAADGLHSPVRRRLGLDGPPAQHRRYGLRCHVEMAPWTDFVEVHWSRLAEAYVTPVAPDLVGVAVLSSAPGPFDQLLEGFPALRGRLRAQTGSQVRGAGPLRQRSRRRVHGRVLLVGDAAGYVDALTGEGIAVGMAQARAAVEAIAADNPRTYERSWRAITWKHDLLTHGLLRATRRPEVRRRLVPAAAALPAVFGAAVNALASPS